MRGEDLCETHGRLRCGECAYVEQLEEEIAELKEELKQVERNRRKWATK